jgi:anti-sigma factor RsiW
MNIDRNNYEEFFILYLDNELSASDRQRVEDFAAANPDLKAELDLLTQSKLTPDMEITFSGKEALLKMESGISSDTTSMLLYLDQELPTAEKASFEQWLAQNPAAQKELGLLQQTKLQPEHIAFPYKDSLYRHEERRVVPIRWWRMAAAAVLLLGVSSAAFMINQNRSVKTLAGRTGENAGSSFAQAKDVAAKKDTPSSQIELSQTLDQVVTNSDSKIADQTTAVDQTADATNETSNTLAKVKATDLNLAQQSSARPVNDQTTSVNATPEETDHVVAKRTQLNTLLADNSYTSDEFQADPSLTISKQINPLPAVTQEDDQPLDIMNEPGKKNKLRGFFRKITRTFEKTTNIKATDGEDRLLVGGLAIKF